MTNAAEVYLWNTRVGIIRLDDTDGYVKAAAAAIRNLCRRGSCQSHNCLE